MFQGKRPLRTASPSCGRVEEVELSVNVQLTSPIARAGCLIQVVPHTIQDDPRESTCKGVTPFFHPSLATVSCLETANPTHLNIVSIMRSSCTLVILVLQTLRAKLTLTSAVGTASDAYWQTSRSCVVRVVVCTTDTRFDPCLPQLQFTLHCGR
jgi:hypothetical protein